jgi:hypothetical protein
MKYVRWAGEDARHAKAFRKPFCGLCATVLMRPDNTPNGSRKTRALQLRSCWMGWLRHDPLKWLGSANRQFEASTVPVEYHAVGGDRCDDGFANAIALVQPVAIEDDEALRGVVIPHVHA